MNAVFLFEYTMYIGGKYFYIAVFLNKTPKTIDT